MFIVDFFRTIVTLGGNFDWPTVKQYLFDSTIVQGAEITILLAVLAQALGVIIGLLLYLIRRSPIGILRAIGEFYVWFFRGTPLLVQLLFLYGFVEEFHFARPIRSIDFFPSLGYQYVYLEFFLPALVAFALNEGAYMAEIVRAGIDSIDPGQMEAAKSLGMTYGMAMRRVILPQAARVILPPLGNEFNSMLKTTSLASTIGVLELYEAAFDISHTLFRPLELAVVASLWYLAMTTLWGFVQSWLERRFNASNLEGPRSASFIDRLLGRARVEIPAGEAAQEAILTGGRR